MKKDIVFPPVEGISIAVVRKIVEEREEWYVYLLNNNDYPLENLMISSRGYGELDGEKRLTSTLRQAFGTLSASTQVLIEPIDPALFPLNNEYWVSYYVGEQIYDKRFVFVPESIIEANLIPIPALNMLGVLHE